MGLCDAPHNIVILCCVILQPPEQVRHLHSMNDCVLFCEEQSMRCTMAGCRTGSAASGSAQGLCLHGGCTR